jgi:hypothetical protein
VKGEERPGAVLFSSFCEFTIQYRCIGVFNREGQRIIGHFGEKSTSAAGFIEILAELQ